MDKIFKTKQSNIHFYIDKKLFDIMIQDTDKNKMMGFSISLYDKYWYKQVLPKVIIDLRGGYSLLFDWLIFSYFTWIH